MSDRENEGPRGFASRFRAIRNAPNQACPGGNTTIVFNQENFDTLDEYDNATGIFTPRKSGYYLLNASVFMGQVFAALVLVSVQFWHPGVTSFDAHHIQLPNGVNMGVNISAVYYIPKGANMQVQLTHAGVGNVLVNAGLEFTAFSAHRLS